MANQETIFRSSDYVVRIMFGEVWITDHDGNHIATVHGETQQDAIDRARMLAGATA